MPATCSAYNCTNRSNKTTNISYFRFPLKKKEILQKWVTAMRRAKWYPTCCSYLCSTHFEDKYIYGVNGRKKLLNEAVPTIFNFPEHFKKHQSIRQVLKTSVCEETLSRNLVNEPPPKTSAHDETLPENLRCEKGHIKYENAEETLQGNLRCQEIQIKCENKEDEEEAGKTLPENWRCEEIQIKCENTEEAKETLTENWKCEEVEIKFENIEEAEETVTPETSQITNSVFYIKHDHSYSVTSLEKLKAAYDFTEQKFQKLKKKYKVVNQALMREKEKVANQQKIIQELNRRILKLSK